MCLCRCFKDAQTEDLSFQIEPEEDGVPPTHSFTYFASSIIQKRSCVFLFSVGLSKFVIL